MEQAEVLLKRKRRILEHRMRIYTTSQLNSTNFDLHEAEMKETQQFLLDLILSIEEHIDLFSHNLSQERIAALNSEVPALENKFVVYKDSFVTKLTELKNTSVILSMNNLSLSDSVQVQQNAAKKKVKAKLEAIMEDLVKLSRKASKVEDSGKGNERK